MLVLSRKYGEQLMIGHEVVITILGYNKDGVRVGIDAKKSIPVHRREIYEKIYGEPNEHREINS